MTALCACALCAAVFGAVLKKDSRELALLLTTGTAALVLLAGLEDAGPLLERILGAAGPTAGPYLSVMVKAVGIGLLGQFTSQSCKDAGDSALSFAVEMAARAAILAAALPVLLELLDYLGQILGG